MKYIKLTVLLTTIFLSLSINKVFAKAQYLDDYKKNPYHKAKYETCGLCHTSSAGGGSRNSFGDYYANHGHSFSRSLMSAYPQFFNVPDGGFLTNVSWDIQSTDLTPTQAGNLAITVTAKPSSLEGNILKYSITVPASVSKYVSFSATTGQISFDESNQASTSNITLTPTVQLSSGSMLRKISKKPLSFKVTMYPYDNDGTTVIKDQGKQITFYAHSD